MKCPHCKAALRRETEEKVSCPRCRVIYTERALNMPSASERVEAACRAADDPMRILKRFEPEGLPN